MKNFTYFRKAAFLAMMLLPLFVTGCRYDLVDEPSLDYNEHKTAADYKDFILPPSKVNASHGECKAVNLSWEAVENAVQYQVFAAESPFSTFSKVSETKGTETEIIIEEESGITKYYCISAVNYYGTISSKSIVVCGSTLAVPIITAIEPSDEGNAVNVSWWMDNCSAETYENDVSYNINVYALSAQNVIYKTLIAEGNVREIDIDGLTSKTEYYFEVEVVNTKSGSKECSEKTTAETAHRVIPDAPQAFTVTKGESKEKITLSWQLPDMVWYREQSGVSGFALHALYFNIYRKLSTQADTEYTLLYAYHVTPVDNYNPDDYIPGDTVIWDDEYAVHDKKYTYYIQSVTDGTAVGKAITADSSKTEADEGWLVSIPTFSINAEYTKSEDLTAFEKITFSFNSSFETFGQAYKYVIKREKYDLNDPAVLVSGGEEEWTFTSLSDLNEGKDVFDAPASALGYYKYTLYVCPASSTDISDAYHEIDASGKFLVTNDANAVPEVETFNLIDGYSNKFVFQFTYKSSYTYTIHWQNVVDGVSQPEESYEIPAEVFETATEGDLFEYEHKENVTSGDRRIYTLEASMGLSERFRPNADTTDKVYETLGTAAPVITEYDYDKLLVEWPAVQKAKDDYTVSAEYADEAGELVIADGEDANCVITKVDADGNDQTTDDIKFTCVITKPAGYDDASKSGKAIKFKVTAQNETTSDTTDSTIDVCTVGPARTSVTFESESKKSTIIDIKWTPIEGADGYIIRRITYKTVTQRPDLIADDNVANPDVYYYDSINNTLTINNEPADGSRASVNLVQGSYKLTDTYKEADDDTSPYEVNQSYIAWGIPFGYTVIPVKHDGSPNDFNLAGRTVSFDGNTYVNIDEKFGSTIGYGLNVHAQKSESADTQVLEWDEPYDPAESYTIYYRNSGSSANSWQKFSKKTEAGTSGVKQTISFKPDSTTAAYEYLIAYNQTSPSLTEVIPASFIKDIAIGLSSKETSSTYDYTGVDEEKANKGYLLSVDYTPETGDGYKEIVNWDAWDYNYRSIGPSKGYICIKNYNITDSWIRVAELNKDLHFIPDTGAEYTIVQKSVNDTSITIEPATEILMDGTSSKRITKGPLMVLRDAKHYYALELIRPDGSSIFVADNSKYAYRNLTDYEFAKMIMAIFSNAFINIDILNFENKSDGNASFTHDSIMQLGYNYDYRFNNYTSNLLVPSGKNIKSQSISCSGTCTRNNSGIEGYPKEFKTVTITLNKTDDLPANYERSITFVMSKHSNATITSGTTTITLDSDELRRIYVPFKLYGDENNYYQDSTYGWWTE